MKLKKIFILTIFMANFGLIHAKGTTKLAMLKAATTPKKVSDIKVITVSEEPINEVMIHNDTLYPVTLVSPASDNSNFLESVTIDADERFPKNTNGNNKWLLYDFEKKHFAFLECPATINSSSDWRSKTVLVSTLLK